MNRHEANTQRLRRRLMEVGVEVILEKGYDATRVSEICRRADYGRSTFYLHFADKEALVWAVLEHNLALMDAQVHAATAGLVMPEREWVAWVMIFESVPFQSAFYQQLNGELSRRLRQWQRDSMIATFERQLREGVYALGLDVPPDLAARFIVGSLMEILEYWLYHPDVGDAATLAAHYFRLVFRRDPPAICPQAQIAESISTT